MAFSLDISERIALAMGVSAGLGAQFPSALKRIDTAECLAVADGNLAT